MCANTEAEVNVLFDEYCSETDKQYRRHAPCAFDNIYPRSSRLARAINDADAMVAILQARLENSDTCVAVYSATIDKKVSDVTTRQSDQVDACKKLGQYPPKK